MHYQVVMLSSPKSRTCHHPHYIYDEDGAPTNLSLDNGQMVLTTQMRISQMGRIHPLALLMLEDSTPQRLKVYAR